MRHVIYASALLLVSILPAATPEELIAQLGSRQKDQRTAGIEALRQLGNAAELPLRKAKDSGKLDERQLALVGRLLGDLLVSRSALKPIDLSALTPCGEDRQAGVVGDPRLLLNTESRVMVLDGHFEVESGPLEFLSVSRVPDAPRYESLLSVMPLPRDISAALFACSYTYAGEFEEEGAFKLPADAGVIVSVEFLWRPVDADHLPQVDPVALAEEIRAKNAALATATPEARKLLLWDLEGDIAYLAKIVPYPKATDSAARQGLLEALPGHLRDSRQVYDDVRREAMLSRIQEYVRFEKGGVLPEVAAPKIKQLIRVPIECFAWNTSTEAPMRRAPFAFTCSRIEKNPRTGKPIFVADLTGFLLALKYDPYAVLNTPLDTRNVDPNHSAGYLANVDVAPHGLSRCRLVFEPWRGGELKAEDLKDVGDRKSEGVAPNRPGAR